MRKDDKLSERRLLDQRPDATTGVVPASVVEQLELLPVLEPERSGPPEEADIGRSIGIAEVCGRWGIGESHTAAIHAVARRNGVTVDMCATPLVAHALISAGAALARPAAIAVEPIDEMDVVLGMGHATDVGKIAVVDPSRLTLPPAGPTMDPTMHDLLRARLLLRHAEARRTRDAIDALARSGTIRIEPDGLIVNTGLAGPRELPFAMGNRPFAVHGLDGRLVDAPVLDAVLDGLAGTDTGIGHGRAVIAADDPPLALLARLVDPTVREHPEALVPYLRLGDGGPAVVGHPRTRRGSHAATTLDLADPADHAAARQTFADLVVRNPASEFALMSTGLGGKWFIVRGTASVMRSVLDAVTRMATLPSRRRITVEAWSGAAGAALDELQPDPEAALDG